MDPTPEENACTHCEVCGLTITPGQRTCPRCFACTSCNYHSNKGAL
jgi:uncharacterized OB-fold protein